MTIEKLSALEERITRLVDTVKQAKQDHIQLSGQIDHLQQELASQEQRVQELSGENERLKQVEADHQRYLEERQELHQRLERMLAVLQQEETDSGQ